MYIFGTQGSRNFLFLVLSTIDLVILSGGEALHLQKAVSISALCVLNLPFLNEYEGLPTNHQGVIPPFYLWRGSLQKGFFFHKIVLE